jgi:hypothetical protein
MHGGTVDFSMGLEWKEIRIHASQSTALSRVFVLKD